jgi:hypothetical protein
MHIPSIEIAGIRFIRNRFCDCLQGTALSRQCPIHISAYSA